MCLWDIGCCGGLIVDAGEGKVFALLDSVLDDDGSCAKGGDHAEISLLVGDEPNPAGSAHAVGCG